MNRIVKGTSTLAACLATGAVLAQTVNPTPTATIPEGQAHIIGAAKLIIGEVKENQTFYEKVFGLKAVSHYSAKDAYDEPIMGFAGGARLALFHPPAEAPLAKSQFPVVLIYTPSVDEVVKRLEEGQYKFRRLTQAEAGTFVIAVARDPSGNAVEILQRADQGYEVGGAKLIVNDRQKAEDFYVRVFGTKPGQRYVTAAYDEVLMQFGKGPFLALFQPKSEAPLPKSQFPVVAIYTKEFDAVLQRLKDAGIDYREVKAGSPASRIVVTKDPAGNGVEIIRAQ